MTSAVDFADPAYHLTPSQWKAAIGMGVYVKDIGRGTLEYFGPIDIDDGPDMMGIALKEPKGDCDGASPIVKGGPKLFVCKPGHGMFVSPDEATVMLLDHWNAAMAEQYEKLVKEKQANERKAKAASTSRKSMIDDDDESTSSASPSSPPKGTGERKPSKKKKEVSPKDATNARLARLAKIRENGDPTVQLRRPRGSSEKHHTSSSAAAPKQRAKSMVGSKGTASKSSPAGARATSKASPAGASPKLRTKGTPGSKSTTPKASPAGTPSNAKSPGKGSPKASRAQKSKSDGADDGDTSSAASNADAGKGSPRMGRSSLARASSLGNSIDDHLPPARPHPFLDADEVERRRSMQQQTSSSRGRTSIAKRSIRRRSSSKDSTSSSVDSRASPETTAHHNVADAKLVRDNSFPYDPPSSVDGADGKEAAVEERVEARVGERRLRRRSLSAGGALGTSEMATMESLATAGAASVDERKTAGLARLSVAAGRMPRSDSNPEVLAPRQSSFNDDDDVGASNGSQSPRASKRDSPTVIRRFAADATRPRPKTAGARAHTVYEPPTTGTTAKSRLRSKTSDELITSAGETAARAKPAPIHKAVQRANMREWRKGTDPHQLQKEKQREETLRRVRLEREIREREEAEAIEAIVRQAELGAQSSLVSLKEKWAREDEERRSRKQSVLGDEETVRQAVKEAVFLEQKRLERQLAVTLHTNGTGSSSALSVPAGVDVAGLDGVIEQKLARGVISPDEAAHISMMKKKAMQMEREMAGDSGATSEDDL